MPINPFTSEKWPGPCGASFWSHVLHSVTASVAMTWNYTSASGPPVTYAGSGSASKTWTLDTDANCQAHGNGFFTNTFCIQSLGCCYKPTVLLGVFDAGFDIGVGAWHASATGSVCTKSPYTGDIYFAARWVFESDGNYHLSVSTGVVYTSPTDSCSVAVDLDSSAVNVGPNLAGTHTFILTYPPGYGTSASATIVLAAS